MNATRLTLYFSRICCLMICAGSMLLPSALRAQVSADFTANATSGCSPLTVQFAQQATGGATTFQWDFGNGNTSNLPNPGVIYVNPGTYTVTLTVSDGTDNATETKTGYITVFADPTADFDLNPMGGCAPLTVTPNDLSVPGDGNIVDWTWDFGDGTVLTGPNPAHTYTVPGTYDVSLSVTDANGCRDDQLRPDLVSVTDGPSATVDFTLPTLCQLPYTVDFTANVTGTGPFAYVWNFGDGGSSTQANPSHSYAAPGTYTVELVVSDAGGCATTVRLEDRKSVV